MADKRKGRLSLNTQKAALDGRTGLKVPVKFSPRREGDTQALYADSTMAQREIGWKPKFMAIESLVETAWRWHASRPDGYGRRPR